MAHVTAVVYIISVLIIALFIFLSLLIAHTCYVEGVGRVGCVGQTGRVTTGYSSHGRYDPIVTGGLSREW